MTPLRLLTSLFVLVGLSSCFIHVGGDGDWDEESSLRFHRDRRHYGSGITASQTRDVAEFDRIAVEGGNMNVIVEVGATRSVYVKGDDDLLPRLETRVEEGTLVIDLDSIYQPVHDFELRIGIEALRSVDLSGSGNIEVAGISGESFDVSLSGSGDIDASGSARMVAVQLSGSGDADTGSLASTEAHVWLSGSGTITVDASEKLAVTLSGSGSVYYSGNPVLEQHISGSGSITSR